MTPRSDETTADTARPVDRSIEGAIERLIERLTGHPTDPLIHATTHRLIEGVRPMRTVRTALFAAALAAAPACTDKPPADPGFQLQPVKEFTCADDAVKPGSMLAPGTDGSQFVLRPTGVACKFEVVYISAEGVEMPMQADPGGFLLGNTASPAPGRRVMCVSNVLHSGGEAGQDGKPTMGRHIDGVRVDCAVERPGNTWSPMVAVVQSDSSWAAWVVSVGWDEGKQRWSVTYVRDFSFQFLNLDDRGRPPTDGIYQASFTDDPATGPKLAETVKLRDKTIGADGVKVNPLGAM